MPIADKKKCQTMINIVAQEVQKLQASATRLDTLRSLFVAHAPDTTGTPLDGHLPAISNWIDSVRAAADSAVPNAFLAHVVPTHRDKALGEIV